MENKYIALIRPYKNTEELIKHFNRLFKTKEIPAHAMPLIWVTHKYLGRVSLITSFSINSVTINGKEYGMNILADCFTFLDGTECKIKIKKVVYRKKYQSREGN